VKKVIKHLEQISLIDDKSFVRWFVEQRIILKPKSKFILTQELLKHGVDKEEIEKYFSKNEINEEGLAERILRERWHRYRNLDKRKRFEKAAGFLMRRGFNFEIAKKIINSFADLS
jgi:regulatory protein